MIQRLVILAPNWLGDAVMALPFVADLRRAMPAARVAVAARPSVAPLFELVPEVSETIRLQRRDGVAALAAGAYEAAVLLPNSFASAWTAYRARIPERWGFATDWRSRLLTRAIRRPRGQPHQAEYYQALGAGLGFEPGPRFARAIVSEALRERARALLADRAIASDRPFVVMAPGAAYGRAKQWLPERFAELAAMLAARDVATVLIGARADAPVCAQIARHAAKDRGGAEVSDLSNQTDLPALAGVLSLAHAVVANDSGAMHLAAAVGTRVVAVFGATDERRTAPLSSASDGPAASIVATSVWCRPCMLRECPIDHRCMSRISARAVLDALAE